MPSRAAQPTEARSSRRRLRARTRAEPLRLRPIPISRRRVARHAGMESETAARRTSIAAVPCALSARSANSAFPPQIAQWASVPPVAARPLAARVTGVRASPPRAKTASEAVPRRTSTVEGRSAVPALLRVAVRKVRIARPPSATAASVKTSRARTAYGMAARRTSTAEGTRAHLARQAPVAPRAWTARAQSAASGSVRLAVARTGSGTGRKRTWTAAARAQAAPTERRAGGKPIARAASVPAARALSNPAMT
jgi:hypothetical protein